MINENTYHSRSLCTSPRSAAKAPSWQVTLESTRMIVFGSASARLRCTGWGPSVGGQAPVFTDRIVKYIANSAAKNINSDESHTIVPTLTMFGLVTDPWEGICSNADAVVTGAIYSQTGRCRQSGSSRT